MARTRSEQYPEIRDKILQRAAAVFARTGYASSTITDIATATDLSRGALYHYFPSKEAILYEILNLHVMQFHEIVEQAMGSSRVAVEQLRAVTKAIVNVNSQSPNEQIVLLNEINELSSGEREKMEKVERQILDLVSDVLIRVDVNAKITQANKRVYTMMYLGIINYTFTWYNPKGKVTPAEYADLATDLFLNGLLTKTRSVSSLRKKSVAS